MPGLPPLSSNLSLTTMTIKAEPPSLPMKLTSKSGGIKGYIWFIMDAVSRSILGYQVSDNRSVGPCILAMRMAFPQVERTAGKFPLYLPMGTVPTLLQPSSSSINSVRSSTLILPRSSGLRTRTKSPKSSALSNR